MTTHSSILAWKTPWMEEPSRLQSTELKMYVYPPNLHLDVDSNFWHPTPVLLPGKPHGWRSLVGYSPWGCRRVGHDLATEEQ